MLADLLDPQNETSPTAGGDAAIAPEAEAAPPIVDTENATIGRLVENAEVESLPIVNRNVYTLLQLTAGVQSSENTIVLGYPEQRTLINGGVDGGTGSVSYYLDGGTKASVFLQQTHGGVFHQTLGGWPAID